MSWLIKNGCNICIPPALTCFRVLAFYNFPAPSAPAYITPQTTNTFPKHVTYRIALCPPN